MSHPVPCEESEAVRGCVFDIQRMSIHDGPGIRTTVFLKGCPLACVWCHNPESRDRQPQLAFTPNLCIGCGFCFGACPNDAHAMVDGVHQLLRERCQECFDCAAECYTGALEVIGKEMTVGEVLDEVVKDRVFYEESGGGMTLSGGEPLAQPTFAVQVLTGAKARGIHTCVETSGFVAREQLADAIPVTALFLCDYKETDPVRHEAYTGGSNARVIENLRFLDAQGARLILRCPVVPGLNLRDDHLKGIVEMASSLRHCQAIHIMGHHGLGESKRTRLGVSARSGEWGDIPDMTRDEVDAVVARVRALGGVTVVPG